MGTVTSETSDQLAAELLGVPSVAALARSLATRAMLPNGRVEAHEYGRDQHSSASAGGMLIGLSGSYGVPDSVVAPLIRAVAALVDRNGRVRTHDGDAESGDNTWSQSQVLLGLLQRPRLIEPDTLTALIARLLTLRDSGGGWPLREGDLPSLMFTFYPVLALARAIDLGLAGPGVPEALHTTATFIESGLRSGRFSTEWQLLARFALERILHVNGRLVPSDLARQRAHLIDACWQADGGLRIHDQPVTVTRQPVWHSMTWRPLLYLCLRRWVSPLSVLGVLVGGELITAFDRDLAAWRGPEASVNLGSGSSWASALALRGVTALAHDLARINATAAEFTARYRQLSTEGYVYDVAISFAGADRPVAEAIAHRLKADGLRVFYDRDQQHILLGEDLAALLHNTYYAESRFAVVVVSRAFLASKWAGNWELKAVLARMQQQHSGYVLPYVMEDVAVPGLSPTLGHVAAADFTADEFAQLVIRKFRSKLRG
jgi:hypothetical protein